MRRRTRYYFPSLVREANPVAWLWRWRNRLWRKGRLPAVRAVVPARALHASFLMARRAVFQDVGRFAEGYRFAHEDLEWCWRAEKKGIGRYVVSSAQAFKLPPQLYGALPPTVRVAMTHSLWRLVAATRGPTYAATYRRLSKVKSLCKWALAGTLSRILCGNSPLLADEAAVHRAIWRLHPGAVPDAGLSPDIESHVRWESAG